MSWTNPVEESGFQMGDCSKEQRLCYIRICIIVKCGIIWLWCNNHSLMYAACMIHIRSYHVQLILFSALEHHPAPPPYHSITSNAWDAPKYSTLSSSPSSSSQRFNLPQCELFSRDDFAISSSVQSNPAFQPDQPIGNKRLVDVL